MSGSDTFVLNREHVRTEQATSSSQRYPLLGMYPGSQVVVDVIGAADIGLEFGDSTVVATISGTANTRSYHFKAGFKETVTPSGAVPPTHFAIISYGANSDVQVTCGSGA